MLHSHEPGDHDPPEWAEKARACCRQALAALEHGDLATASYQLSVAMELLRQDDARSVDVANAIGEIRSRMRNAGPDNREESKDP